MSLIKQDDRQERINQLLRRFEQGKELRRRFEVELWQPAMEFCDPQAGSMISGRSIQPGEKRGRQAYEGTPVWAKSILVNGLVSGLIPDNYKWFKWSVFPLWLNDNAEVEKWLQKCEDVTYLALNDTNYSEASAAVFDQQATYGTGCKYTEYDLNKLVVFQTLRLTDFVIFENARGRVDSLFREFKWSVRNAFKEWGDRSPDLIKRAYESGNYDDEYTFYHFVFPREDYDTSRSDRQNMPWASLWVCPREKKLLDEGGYRIFPFSVPRWWKAVGEGPWGRGPAIQALQDMGVLNQQEKINLLAAHKMVEPALAIPHDGFTKALDLGPGGQNTYNSAYKGRIEPIVTIANLPFALDQQEKKAQAVARHFHTDVFLMLNELGKDMTAFEVMERKQEKLMILGPTLGRQRQEHLDSDLDIIFHLLLTNGHFPPMPDILLQYGEKIETQYISPLAIAQRRMDIGATMRVYQTAGEILKLTGKTDALDALNDERAIRLIADREAVPIEILNSEEEMRSIKEAKARQAQQAQAAQMALAATQGAKNLGDITTMPEKPNLLTDIVKNAQGAQ